MVLDLALGRLDDDRARVAERARQTCPSCRSWWEDSLAGEPAVEVDRAVAEVFSSFEAPAHHHYRRLWLAAAAAFFVAALGLLLEPGQGGKSSLPGGGVAQDALAQGARPSVTSAVKPAARKTGADSDRIFAADFESGTIGETGADSDRIFAAELEPGTVGETGAHSGRIFAADFESGDIASWSL